MKKKLRAVWEKLPSCYTYKRVRKGYPSLSGEYRIYYTVLFGHKIELFKVQESEHVWSRTR